MSCLLDAKRIPEGDVDSIKREYSSFVQEVHDNSKVLEGFQSYSVCVRIALIASLLPILRAANIRNCGILLSVY